MNMTGKRIIPISIFVLTLLLVSCVDSSTQSGTKIEGLWGAEHIELIAEDDSVQIEYDCARGTIDSALIPDSDGNFIVFGTHTLGGGPVNLNDPPPDARPARYQGHIIGNRLELTITLTDTGDIIGPFVLEHDEPGFLYKCQ